MVMIYGSYMRGLPAEFMQCYTALHKTLKPDLRFYCPDKLIDGPVSSQVLDNVDELFQRDELSAAPDPGWPDCFNSGVFVFQPSHQTYASLRAHALQHGSFDGNSPPHHHLKYS